MQQKKLPALNESSLRLAFLEQAASILATPKEMSSKTPTSDLIARILLHEIREISFADQARMHRDFKRSFCKKCFAPWAQAVSIGITPFKNGSNALTVICRSCRNDKQIKLASNYKSRNEKAGRFK